MYKYDQKYIFLNKKRYLKRQNFKLISNRLKKLLKMHKKVISKTSLTNTSKSENSAYFPPVFANNFFGAFFQKIFNGFRNQRKFLRFLVPILNF
jgi:hypothetical protein